MRREQREEMRKSIFFTRYLKQQMATTTIYVCCLLLQFPSEMNVFFNLIFIYFIFLQSTELFNVDDADSRMMLIVILQKSWNRKKIQKLLGGGDEG